MDKAQIRQLIVQQKRSMTAKEIAGNSAVLTRMFLQSPEYQAARTLFAYVPINQEVITNWIIEEAIKAGKRVAVPVVEGADLTFRYITSTQDLKPGTYGILEPGPEQPCADPEPGENGPEQPCADPEPGKNGPQQPCADPEPEEGKPESADAETRQRRILMLMPGLAFDRSGLRVGYGKGLYDRYLARHQAQAFTKIALCYDFQLLEQIQGDLFDQRVDQIIAAPSGKVIHCREKQK